VRRPALIFKSSNIGVIKSTNILYFGPYKDDLTQEDQDKAIKLADEWIKNFKAETSKDS